MKKLISLLLALMMVFSLATAAFATDATNTPITGTYGTDKGTITINKYNDKNNYTLYRMLRLESFSTAGVGGTYSYIIEPGWEAFFAEGGNGAKYVTVDPKTNYVTWKTGVSDSLAPTFAKEALEYADNTDDVQKITASDFKAATGATTDGYPTYTFNDLDLGYYLVDSTMGALCGLTTTNLHASINAKNGEPTLNKQVQEDSTEQWVTENTADIGQTVHYRATITVAAGAQDYMFHDTMDSTLTFVKVTGVTYDGTPIAPTETKADGTSITNYTVVTGDNTHCSEHADHPNCTFEVQFSDTFCDSISNGKSLIIFYEAILNENAIIAGSNVNSAQLEFGEKHFTTKSEVTTKTYAFDLVKTDGQNALLPGAFFEMYKLLPAKDAEGNDQYEIVKLAKVTDTETGKWYYRPALAEEIEANAANTIITEFEVEGGIIRFQGFDSGDYYFKETKNPAGYNILKEMAKFTLGDVNKNAIFNDGIYSSGSGFHITNQAGTMLPETGAKGTAAFITFGVVVMLATGCLLVTRKRLSMIED